MVEWIDATGRSFNEHTARLTLDNATNSSISQRIDEIQSNAPRGVHSDFRAPLGGRDFDALLRNFLCFAPPSRNRILVRCHLISIQSLPADTTS